MERLVYMSEPAPDLGSGELFQIISTSVRNNATRDITGVLALAGGSFVQAIEGPTQSLDALMNSLESDPRHTNIRILARDAIIERAFPQWRMKRLESGDLRPLVTLLERDRGAEPQSAEVVRLLSVLALAA